MNMLKTDIRTTLSTLWIFVLFNIIFRDLHEFGRPGFLADMMAGTFDGVPITEEMMLLGGIMIELIIIMVLFSRFLPYALNRWANIVISILIILYTVTNGGGDLDNYFFAAVETVALSLIIWLAWTWPPEAEKVESVVSV